MNKEFPRRLSSLAVPTEADLALWRDMSIEERRACIAEVLEEGQRDIQEGRYTEINSREDLHRLFDSLTPEK